MKKLLLSLSLVFSASAMAHQFTCTPFGGKPWPSKPYTLKVTAETANVTLNEADANINGAVSGSGDINPSYHPRSFVGYSQFQGFGEIRQDGYELYLLADSTTLLRGLPGTAVLVYSDEGGPTYAQASCR